MAKFVVDEFVIELNLEDKITKALPKLEKAVNKVSADIEKKLNGSFSKDFTKPLRDSFDRLERHATNTAKNIDKQFAGIGKRTVDGRKMFRSVSTEAVKAAREAQRALNGIRVPPVGSPRRGGGSGAGGGSPRPGQSPGERLFARATNSAAFQRLQISGGSGTIAAREAQARLSHALERAAGDANQSAIALARFREELREATAAAREEARATRQNAQADRAAARSERSGGVRGAMGGATRGLTGAFVKGGLILDAIESAVELGKRAVERGYEQTKERAQASTMLKAAVGEQAAPQVQNQISAYSNRYGLDRTETTMEFAKNRAVFNPAHMSNDALLKMMENESIFAHASGVSQQGVKSANVAIAQIAGSNGHINKQDLNQLGSWIPEYSKVIAAGMGTTIEKAKAGFKTMKPDDFVKYWQAGLQKINDASGAALAAQKSLPAAEGRFAQAMNDDLNALMQSSGDGFANLLDLLARGMEFAIPYFEWLGKNLAVTVNAIEETVNWLGNWKQNLIDLKNSLPPGFVKLLDEMGDAIAKVARNDIAAINHFFERIKYWWDWFTSQDADAPRSKKYGSSVEAGSKLEAGLDWVTGKLHEFNQQPDTYAAGRDSNGQPLSPFGGAWDNLKNNADIMAGKGYSPQSFINQQSQQALKGQFTTKLDVTDKPIEFKIDLGDLGTHSVTANLKDMIHSHEESFNYQTDFAHIDYSVPYQ